VERVWIEVASGDFAMGSPSEEVGHQTNEPQHDVSLSHDFVILASEVMQADFEEVMGYNPSFFGPEWPGNECGPDCPVDSVSWHEAAGYCNNLSASEGFEACYNCTGEGIDLACTLSAALLTPYDCLGYRLPTEAEWEMAARGPTQTATYNGDLPEGVADCEFDNPILAPIAWFCGNSDQKTHPSGLKAPNDLDLFDMLGNVREWCQDWYSELNDQPAADPWGPADGQYKVVRGASYSSEAPKLRAGFRNGVRPSAGGSQTGLRPVRTLP